jgi:CubicO group peptidase (beta-lactamase class C family)
MISIALRLLAGAAAFLCLASIASAEGEGSFDRAAGAHFNRQKLERIGELFRSEIADRRIPGAIVLIQQHGRPVYFEKFGVRDVATGLPMTDDTIFTVYSMSKPVTSVAALMLVDEGKLKLDDPLQKYIPAFASAKVGLEPAAGNGEKKLELVPLQRPITIVDLMRHTSGITYGFYGDSLVRKLYANALLYAGDFDNAEFAERIARLPLAEQPGTLWDYGHSTDVLGRVIEVIAGKSLLQFEKEKLLDPLGMIDTGFYITDPAKLPLLAQTMPDDNNFSAGLVRNARRMLKWESGGGGMISTVTDFARFSQMLLNGGALDGKQYLSPRAFRELAADHVGPDSQIARDYLYFPGDGFGYGLGLAVRTDPGIARPPAPGSLGELKWDGASGCYFLIDRKQDMFVILMQQTPSQRQRIQAALKKLVYEALEN